jgi:hypothetical protein
MAFDLFGEEREKGKSILPADLSVDVLFAKLIEEFVSQRLCSIQALFWGVNHNLAN